MQHITLNNGITMPSIGLETYELCGQKGIEIMQNALQLITDSLITHKCIKMKRS